MAKYTINVNIKKQHKKVKKLKEKLEALKNTSEEMSDELCEMIQKVHIQDNELRYMSDFIRWKNLNEEYETFKQNAYEDPDTELPFPHLIM